VWCGVPWCSGLAYVPVKDEIAGSNPVGTAQSRISLMPEALARRALPSEALHLASRFAKALERYLEVSGGAASRTQIVGVVRTWVPRWPADIPPLLADALIEGLVRQGLAISTRHHVGLIPHVERWRARFRRYPQRLTQPIERVAGDCDVPKAAVESHRALFRNFKDAALPAGAATPDVERRAG
jgi:hypothetical protein